MIHIVVNCIIISPALWLGGRLLVGGKKAKFSDAILIVVIGTIIGVLVGILFSGFFGSIVQLVLWLLLVKHFFDTGCLMALVISIMAVIVFIIIGGILGILGLVLISFI